MKLRFGMQPDESFIIQKFTEFPTDRLIPADPVNDRLGVVVDVETTGIDRRVETVIEVAIRQFQFNKDSGQISTIGKAYNALQDPGRPLHPEIIRVTGLTDADLAGQTIDWSQFDAIIQDAVVVIAHNALFDRQFLQKCTPSVNDKIWADSFTQLDWSGYPASKQEVLALCHGFYYSGHRALNDVDALLYLLSHPATDNDPKTYLWHMLQAAKQPVSVIKAVNSPIETKEILKQQGYTWNLEERVWLKKVKRDQVAHEMAFLEMNIYTGGNPAVVEELGLKEQFRRY